MTVAVRQLAGPAGELHAMSFDAVRGAELWVLDASRPAIVLGSRQHESLLDTDACRLAGVDVAKRSSGGGLVLVEPEEMLWVDVLVAADDPRWNPDVMASMQWCGERWCAALADMGIAAEVAVRPSPPSELSSLVCFGGVGHGEVVAGAAKLVGISQRRTRHGSRFQCALHHAWRPAALAPFLAAEWRRLATELEERGVATVDSRLGADLLEALAAQLEGG